MRTHLRATQIFSHDREIFGNIVNSITSHPANGFIDLLTIYNSPSISELAFKAIRCVSQIESYFLRACLWTRQEEKEKEGSWICYESHFASAAMTSRTRQIDGTVSERFFSNYLCRFSYAKDISRNWETYTIYRKYACIRAVKAGLDCRRKYMSSYVF